MRSPPLATCRGSWGSPSDVEEREPVCRDQPDRDAQVRKRARRTWPTHDLLCDELLPERQPLAESGAHRPRRRRPQLEIGTQQREDLALEEPVLPRQRHARCHVLTQLGQVALRVRARLPQILVSRRVQRVKRPDGLGSMAMSGRRSGRRDRRGRVCRWPRRATRGGRETLLRTSAAEVSGVRFDFSYRRKRA
jgi:hypothetical protein